MLEREPQAELDLAGSAERVDAGSNAYAINVMTRASRPVDLPGSSDQQAVHHVPGQIKVGEIEQIVETDAGLHRDPLANCVGPTDFRIEGAQPRQIDLPRRCQ